MHWNLIYGGAARVVLRIAALFLTRTPRSDSVVAFGPSRSPSVPLASLRAPLAWSGCGRTPSSPFRPARGRTVRNGP
jgi:hypothetical protein